jgi:hypothetical protein
VERKASDHLATITPSLFTLAYRSDRGTIRLTALDTSDGRRRFHVDVPHTGEGSRLASMTADGDDLFVAIDDELLRYDAASGELRARMEVR